MSVTHSEQINHVGDNSQALTPNESTSESNLRDIRALTSGRARAPSLLASIKASGNVLVFLIQISPQKSGVMATLDGKFQNLLGNLREFVEEMRITYWPVPIERLFLQERYEKAMRVMMHRLYRLVKQKGKVPLLNRGLEEGDQSAQAPIDQDDS